MSVSVTLKSYFYEVLIPSSQKNTSSPIEDILHHVSISFMKKLALYKCFNPRTHTGCDASIALIRFIYHRFQSTHPHGVRRHKRSLLPCLIRFQSTHPHGVRLPGLKPGTCGLGFNPRTHTGCDAYRKILVQFPSCFNPRTHTGCDYWPRQCISIYGRFNPRTHTGCDIRHVLDLS